MVVSGFGGRWSEVETKGKKAAYEATTKVQRPELKQCQWKKREGDSFVRKNIAVFVTRQVEGG